MTQTRQWTYTGSTTQYSSTPKIVEQYRLSQPSDTAIIAADVLRWQPDSNLPALELSLDQIFKGFET